MTTIESAPRPDSYANMADLLHHHAVTRPNRTAFIFTRDGETESERMSYAELYARAHTIAAGLEQAPDGPALLLYPPGLEYIAAFFACLAAGVIAVPSHPPRPHRDMARMEALASDSGAGSALTTSDILDRLRRREPFPTCLQALQWHATDAWMAETSPRFRLSSISSPPSGVHPATFQNIAFLQNTSGSTSAPKGVMVSHANLLHNQRMIQRAFALPGSGPVVGWLPFYHDMGLIGNVLQSVYLGRPCILMPPVAFLQNPLRWLTAISHYGAAASGGPDFAYDLCVRRVTPEQRASLDLSRWERAFTGAEPVRAGTLERFARAFEPCGFRPEAFYPCYGLAEATLLVAGGAKGMPPTIRHFEAAELERGCARSCSPSAQNSRRLVSNGQARGGQCIRIVDPTTRSVLPEGRVGEIWVSGPSVASGYWNRSESTAETFGAFLPGSGDGPFLRTGDLGFLQEDNLYITGRIKDLIIIRGRNHYPQDLERTAARSHPAVDGAAGAAFAVSDGKRERLVMAQEVHRRHIRTLDAPSAAAAIRRALSRHHGVHAHSVVLLKPGATPKTSSGKIRRLACRQAWLENRLTPLGVSLSREAAPVGASDDVSRDALMGLPLAERQARLETWLRHEAARVLGMTPEAVDPAAPISHLGLDSLMSMELKNRIDRRLVRIAAELLLEDIPLCDLATRIIDDMARGDRLQSLAAPPAPAGESNRSLPLSHQQERLWFLEQLEAARTTYIITAGVRIDGPLDADLLKQCLAGIAARHETLRTGFTIEAGEPRQLVHPKAPAPPRILDMSHLSPDARETRTDRIMAEEARRPFEPDRPPLARFLLLRFGPDDHVLVVSLHHLISDGWSMYLLLDELARLYGAGVADRPARLPALPVQYGDMAYWQKHQREDAALSGQRTYWRRQLAGIPELLDLPADRPRPAIRTHRGAMARGRLSPGMTSRIRALSRARGATVFMTLLAAFKLLLFKLTGQADIVVGAPIAGRNRAETENLIGFFINTLALRTSLDGSPTFIELLERVRRVCLDAYAHQEFRFETLLETLRPTRNLSHTPIFQVFFNMLGRPRSRASFPGLTVTPLPLPATDARFDLTLYVSESGSGFNLDALYNTDLFTAARIEEMLAQYKELLSQIIAEPHHLVRKYSLVTPRALKQLPNPARPLDAAWHGAIHEWFDRQAHRRPDRIAVCDPHDRWRYAELQTRANQLAHRLMADGVRVGDIVAIRARRNASLVWAMLGILKAGAAFLILDPQYPLTRLRTCLEQARPRMLLDLAGAGERPGDVTHPPTGLDPSNVLVLPDRQGAATAMAGRPATAPETGIGPSDLAYVAFTSGSTGAPKGIRGGHGSLTHFLPWQARTFGFNAADRFSMLSGLSHDPLHRDVFTPLAFGASIRAPDPVDMAPERLPDWMRREGVSVAHLTPALGRILTAGSNGVRLDRLRCAFFVGDALRHGDVAAMNRLAPAAGVVNYYGATETQRAVGYHPLPPPGAHSDKAPVDPAGRRAIIPLGRGIRDVQLLVLNAAGKRAGIGEVGEIAVRSPHIALGCLTDEPGASDRFQPNPFARRHDPMDRLYKTGDLGRYTPDGAVMSMGRMDRQVQIRGFRVEPGEVEAVLKDHASVHEAAVIDRLDASGDRSLVAYVTPDASTPSGADALQRFLRERLPAYMLPSAITRLSELPLTPNGKPDRKALPAPRAQRPADLPLVAPRGEAESKVISAWREALGFSDIGREDNFFDLGGHSMLMIRVQQRLQAEFRREIPLVDLFQHSTVEALAGHLSRADAVADGLQPIRERMAKRRRTRRRRNRNPFQGGDSS